MRYRSTTINEMPYRIPLDFIGNGKAIEAYGGKLEAWSFIEIQPLEWFNNFRNQALESIGKKFFPIYRMADGEYRFLMGRHFNPHRKPIFKEILAHMADKTGLRNKNKWATSWGESYSSDMIESLRKKYIVDIASIAKSGYLAMYINDNGLNAFIEYNNAILPYLEKESISIDKRNYVPFHFPCQLLTTDGRESFYYDRNTLVVTCLTDQKKVRIEKTLTRLSVASVQFLEISANQSMTDSIDLSCIKQPVDICLVAAGIGTSNILRQLEPLQTLAVDIGGLMNCFENLSRSIHGGTFTLADLED